MPELPEVETVKRELEKKIVSLKIHDVKIFVPRLLQTDKTLFENTVRNSTITSLSREGKFLILHLDNSMKLIFHLRMEGKLFYQSKDEVTSAHLSALFDFYNGDFLAFYDVRKFGCLYYLKESERGPLAALAKEPFQMKDSEFYSKLQQMNMPIKEVLLNQNAIAGIGNIYADEILFSSRISPFKLASSLSLDECSKILKNAREILNAAIEFKGSTIRTYKASENVHGLFQNELKVYSKAGCECSFCHKVKIQKWKLNGRSTSFCPICQKCGISLALTGKIASGKSTVLEIFKKRGFVTLSADEEVHKIYSDKRMLKEIEAKFPEVFTPDLNKKMIQEKLLKNKDFKRRYEHFIFSLVKRRIQSFLIENDKADKVVEIPLLFDSHLDSLFPILIGVETTRQDEHLKIRGESSKRMDFNLINSYDANRDKLDFILLNDSSVASLEKSVADVILKINALWRS